MLENISTGHRVPIIPVSGSSSLVKNTESHIEYLLNVSSMNGDLLFQINEENVGIIEYQLNAEKEQCYIEFFGTKNGIEDSSFYKKLHLLSDSDKVYPGVSYSIMQKFIDEICKPNGIKRIYLDPDTAGKKHFWKEKIGKYFLERKIFTRVYSGGFEVCFEITY